MLSLLFGAMCLNTLSLALLRVRHRDGPVSVGDALLTHHGVSCCLVSFEFNVALEASIIRVVYVILRHLVETAVSLRYSPVSSQAAHFDASSDFKKPSKDSSIRSAPPSKGATSQAHNPSESADNTPTDNLNAIELVRLYHPIQSTSDHGDL